MIRRLAPLLLLLASLLALSTPARAHEIRPAYLQIEERAPGRYDLLWKVPARGGMVPDIRPVFEPAAGPEFDLRPLPGARETAGFALFRYALAGDTPLPGARLRIEGLERTALDALVSVSLLDGSRRSFLLKPRTPSVEIPRAPTPWQVLASYTRLGLEHILAGIDHLAFVAALMLVARGWPMLLKTATAFTAAHSITLAMASLGYVSLPPPPVETLIALSILLVAVEAVHLRQGRPSLASRRPWIVAFAFGLLHGFGFAGALQEIGLPRTELSLALLSFNLGVELGQLAFIAAILLALSSLRQLALLPAAAPRLAAYAIGTAAAFWVFERLEAMFG
ncbi:HupE/UreJ family protein [Albimonas pacifica]|uniref:HupE / UreJ protein n=1 Tax=Albimonas pacifica TaxID=1114924 RepID=A0A1I3DGM2_9RHOB|nr:HupE/UreJ family protein [Albimonas pacifica]SFH85641.1 HupE / UreJ protein [Albimonas pacifica]